MSKRVAEGMTALGLRSRLGRQSMLVTKSTTEGWPLRMGGWGGAGQDTSRGHDRVGSTAAPTAQPGAQVTSPGQLSLSLRSYDDPRWHEACLSARCATAAPAARLQLPSSVPRRMMRNVVTWNGVTSH